MALVKSCSFPPCAAWPHTGAFTRNTEAPLSSYVCLRHIKSHLKYLWTMKNFRLPRPERKTLRVRGRGPAPQTRAERTLHTGNVGFGQFKPDWTWSKWKVQSVERWEQEGARGRQTGSGVLRSFDWWVETLGSWAVAGGFAEVSLSANWLSHRVPCSQPTDSCSNDVPEPLHGDSPHCLLWKCYFTKNHKHIL